MKGFSLIEVLVVIVIILIISSIILAYNRNTELNVLIQVEKNKFKALLNQAKNLALEKKNINNEDICGFGVNISFQNYYILKIFGDKKDASGNCNSKVFDEQDVVIQTFNLNPKVIFKDNNSQINNKNIVFTGPYLEVWVDGNKLTNVLTLFLVNKNNENVKGLVKVNSVGAISVFE